MRDKRQTLKEDKSQSEIETSFSEKRLQVNQKGSSLEEKTHRS
jgi:hypothetical protein